MPKRGIRWNGYYGVVDIYAAFQQQPTAVPANTSAYIIDIFLLKNPDVSDQGTGIVRGWGEDRDTLVQYRTCPWVRASLVLGLMTRWKALYLYRGYDKAWSVLQKLRVLAKLPPDEEPTLPDEFHTKANGSWSIRELFGILSSILNAFQQSVSGPFFLGDPSLAGVMTYMVWIAGGSWAGPEQPNILLSRPNSFQSVLSCRA